MNTTPVALTDEVIKDLLTLYLAGEASADTRDLVESYLATVRADPRVPDRYLPILKGPAARRVARDVDHLGGGAER